MTLKSHVSSKRLSALEAGCSSAARSLPFAEGCPISGRREPCLQSRCRGFIPRHRRAVLLLYHSLYATTTGHGSHSHVVHCWSARVRDHSWCSLPHGVPCISSFVAWGETLHDSDASPESRVHGSSRSCGSTSSTCLLSRGAEAATRSDDCPALS